MSQYSVLSCDLQLILKAFCLIWLPLFYPHLPFLTSQPQLSLAETLARAPHELFSHLAKFMRSSSYKKNPGSVIKP